jgi:hypothetical protein
MRPRGGQTHREWRDVWHERPPGAHGTVAAHRAHECRPLVANSGGGIRQLKVSRSTAYRLLKLVRDEEKAERAFLDDRHGHPYKLTEPVRAWLVEFCTTHPQIPSSRVQSELKSRLDVAVSIRETQPGAGTGWGEQPVAGSGSRGRGKKLKVSQPVWQEGIGSFLLLAAAKPPGLLDALVTAVMELADPTIPGLGPPNPAVVERLLCTLLFLPVAGLARTWDLRGYTGTMLARLSGRERAYSQRYTERFLARLAHGFRSRTLDRGDGTLDLVAVAARAPIA